MKKLNCIMLGLATLALASCSQDAPFGPNDGDGNVQINVALPGDLATRAFGTGEAEKILNYGVYDATTNELQFSGSEDMGTDTNYTLKLNLMSGNKYTVVLFAQSTASMGTEDGDNAAYTFNAADGSFSADYSKMNAVGASPDDYDCFAGTIAIDLSSGSGGNVATAALTRPVAQINWGTSDLANEQVITNYGQAGRNATTTLTIENVSSVYNILTDQGPVDDTETTTITLYSIPTYDTEEFPVDPSIYSYIAMQYVIAPASKTYNLTLEVNGNNGASNTTTLNSVQVTANYRTNIYGSLLNKEESANATVLTSFGGFNEGIK